MKDNHREFYRIEVLLVPITIKTINGEYEGTIKDVSKNGLSFYCNELFLFDEAVVFFELGGKEFEFEVQYVRRKYEKSEDIFYATKLKNPEAKLAGKLFSTLMQLDAQKRNNEL